MVLTSQPMTALFNSEWLITVAVAMAVASIPSFLKKMRMLPRLFILLCWFGVVIRIAVTGSLLAAAIGSGVSLLWGLLCMMASLIYSGLRQMANRRYT